MDFNSLPKGWHQITLEQYKELVSVKIGEEYDSSISVLLEQIAILLDTSVDDPIIEELDLDELDELSKRLKWLFQAPKLSYSNEIEVDGQKYIFKEFVDLTLGEFIDLEYWISNSVENFEKICSVLYRKYKIDEWGNIIFEPYSFKVRKRSQIFYGITMNKIYGVIQAYIDWRTSFLDSYSAIFEPNDWDKIDNEEELDPQEIIEMKREIEQEKKLASWSWERILWDLSGNNVANYESIFNTSLILVMNTLSMKKTFSL